MNPWRWVDPRIEQVRVADLKAYFLRRGWRLEPNPNPELLRFEESAGGNGPPFFQMVPASEQTADYRQRITELVTTLSELENRHPVPVLAEILSTDMPARARPRGRSTRSPKVINGPIER
jgi:hypothetical protein